MPISFASIEILVHGPRICILDNFMEYKIRPPGLTRCYAGDGNIPPAERTSRRSFLLHKSSSTYQRSVSTGKVSKESFYY